MWEVLEQCQSTQPEGWNYNQHHFEDGAFKKLNEEEMIEALQWCSKEKKSAGKCLFILIFITSDAFHKHCDILIYRSNIVEYVNKVKNTDKENLEKLSSVIAKGEFILFNVIFVRSI